jgi:hypothetical protein
VVYWLGRVERESPLADSCRLFATSMLEPLSVNEDFATMVDVVEGPGRSSRRGENVVVLVLHVCADAANPGVRSKLTNTK